MKKLLLFITISLSFVFLTNLSTVKADNGIPYYTFTEDSRHQLTYTQTAYMPVAVLDKLGRYTLKNPEDIYIDSENTIYIADSGNKNVIVVEENLSKVYTIGNRILESPTGVFVAMEDDEPMIYVADTDLKKVMKFNKQGDLLQEFTRPTSPLFGDEDSYKPSKVSVDNRGNVYIVDPSNYNGIIQLNKYGDFYGYFGSNYTKPTLRRMVQFMFSTKEQKEKLRLGTRAPANITLNNEGLISAISNDGDTGFVQSFNISGENNIPYARTDFTSLIKLSPTDTLRLTDVTVGPIGNIYVINSVGFISEYDREGNLLFVFGGRDQSGYTEGMTTSPKGIAVDENYNIYVLDVKKNVGKIHVYQPTDFSNLVHQALNDYQEGLYIKSQGPWQEVLKRNSLFDLAHKGLGNAYLKQQMYDKALEQFKMANDKKGYSDSFWEIRNDWLESNLKFIIIALFALVIDFLFIQSYLVKSLIKLIKLPFKPLRKYRLYQELTFIAYFIKHPADGYYGIKREKKVSILAASIFLVIFYLEHIASKVYTGFIFNFTELNNLSLMQEASKTVGVMLLFIISNYLVSSINDGEGKLRDVYKATIYSFVPLILFWPIAIALSNVLTLNEIFIFQATNTILWAWTIMLLFMMIKEVHNYDIRDTIKNIFITIFTMLMIVASLFIFYVLIQQVITFFYDVLLEVKSNG